jgi:histidinol-phosphatase
MADATLPACDPALLAWAADLAHRAGKLALEGFRHPELAVDRKGDGTVVTAYDRAVERLLREAIEAAFPADGVLGEEEMEAPGTSGRRWVLDPIDGTRPYSHGIVTWGVLVACEDEHGPLLGITDCPWAGESVVAGRGLGCTFDGRPARASPRDDLDGAVLATSGIEHWDPGTFGRLAAVGVKVRTWGNAYGLALAATGRVDAFFDAGVKPWDVAPAPVLMAEAGGSFATLDGSGSIHAGTALLCPTALADPLLSLLRG